LRFQQVLQLDRPEGLVRTRLLLMLPDKDV